MANRLLGIFRHQALKFRLGLLVLEMRRLGSREDRSELCPGGLNPAIEGGRHPAQRWMPDPPLDIGENLASTVLIPAPVQVLGRKTELDDEVARKVLRLDLAALFLP